MSETYSVPNRSPVHAATQSNFVMSCRCITVCVPYSCSSRKFCKLCVVGYCSWGSTLKFSMPGTITYVSCPFRSQWAAHQAKATQSRHSNMTRTTSTIEVRPGRHHKSYHNTQSAVTQQACNYMSLVTVCIEKVSTLCNMTIMPSSWSIRHSSSGTLAVIVSWPT
jgi:hypothetical protein